MEHGPPAKTVGPPTVMKPLEQMNSRDSTDSTTLVTFMSGWGLMSIDGLHDLHKVSTREAKGP